MQKVLTQLCEQQSPSPLQTASDGKHCPLPPGVEGLSGRGGWETGAGAHVNAEGFAGSDDVHCPEQQSALSVQPTVSAVQFDEAGGGGLSGGGAFLQCRRKRGRGR